MIRNNRILALAITFTILATTSGLPNQGVTKPLDQRVTADDGSPSLFSALPSSSPAATMQAAAQAVKTVTIVTTFDYSGAQGRPAAGIPGKITIKVKGTNEVLRVSENIGTVETSDLPVIGFNETHFAKEEVVCRCFTAASSLKRYRVLERKDGFTTTYDYEEPLGIMLGLAKAAKVTDKTNSIVASFIAETDIEGLQKPFLSVEEKHYRAKQMIFHARLKVAVASGRFVKEEIVMGQRKANYICSWPTGHYGGSNMSGLPGTTAAIEQEERVP
jgi:hypothetical protein